MKKFFSILLTIFVPLSFTNVSKAAGHMEAEVIHWWTSGGEQAAISEFAKAWEEMGNTWIDTAITGGDNARGKVYFNHLKKLLLQRVGEILYTHLN